MRLVFAALIALLLVALTNGAFAANKPTDPYDVPWKEVPEGMRSRLPERLKAPILHDVARSSRFKIAHYQQFTDRTEAERFAGGRVDVQLCEGCFAGTDVWLVSDTKKTQFCRRLLTDVQAGRFSAIEPELYENIATLLSKPRADRCDPLLRAASGRDRSTSPPSVSSVWRVNLRLYPMGDDRVFVSGAAPCPVEDYRQGACGEVDPTSQPGGMMVNTKTCQPEPGMESRLVSSAFPGSADFLSIVIRVGRTTMVVFTFNQYRFMDTPAELYFVPSEWAGATEYCRAETEQ